MWVAVAAIGLLLCACSSPPKPTPGEMVYEYEHNTHVKNDSILSKKSVRDRLTDIADLGGPDKAVWPWLLGAWNCGDPETVSAWGRTVPRAVADKAVQTTDYGDQLYKRQVLVKHADGRMELLDLYVTQRPASPNVPGDLDVPWQPLLIDTTGATYTSLADFQAKNDLLERDDLMLTQRDITSVPAKGEVVVVPGSTAPPVLQWIIGVAAVVAALWAATTLWRRRRIRQGLRDPFAEPPAD